MGKQQDKPTIFISVPVDKEQEIEFRKILFKAGLSVSEFFSVIVNSHKIRDKYLHALIEDVKNERNDKLSNALTVNELLSSAKIKSNNIFDLLAAKSPLKKKKEENEQ